MLEPRVLPEVTVDDLASALQKSKCVLLEGPPGTGKTRLVGELVATLRAAGGHQAGSGSPAIDGRDQRRPFIAAAREGPSLLPSPTRIEWTTFHQSYSYEDFIVGRRPKVIGAAIELQPVLGLLMDIAITVGEGAQFRSGLLVIDEINRANASRVLGEFITYMDPGYRAQIAGQVNPRALAVRLPGISYSSLGASEPVRRLDGNDVVVLDKSWSLPEHIYVLATMNSVDKAAVPLDSALSRRFHRIRMRPSPAILARELKVDLNEVHQRVQAARAGDAELEWTAAETAIALLERLNGFIASNLGQDYELGHGLLLPLIAATPGSEWAVLASVWDTTLLPQLQDRFLGNRLFLREVLRVDDVVADLDGSGNQEGLSSITPALSGTLGAMPIAEAATILRNIAR